MTVDTAEARVAGAATTATTVFEARDLAKRFGPVEVLSSVSITLVGGQVHAVIGENGAGKSTLMKLLAGHLEPTRGTLVLDGQTLTLKDPAAAERHGIVLVHQEILLALDLTVAQNIFMGREIRRGLALDDRTMNRRAAQAVGRLGVEIDPRASVRRLSIAQRQLVQIARALETEPRIIIFDEPTASLTSHETSALLGVIQGLRRRGVAILYISHRLAEVAAVADTVTVLRDGRHITTRPAEGLSPLDMAHLMVGRDMARLFPALPPMPHGQPLLEVEGLSVPGFVSDISFELRPGEILGFAGLIGAGRTEAFEGLLGLRAATQKSVRLDGRSVRFRSVRDSLKVGIVYLSEDRKGKGLLLGQTLRVNLTLATLEHFCRGAMVDRAREQQGLDQAIERFDIRVRRKDMLAGQLSGGNQQKLLLAKMMLREPRIVVIDEPTRGIDIGTKEQIYRFVSELAAAGKTVVVISSEMQELIGLCHRILVMRNGQVVGETTGERMTEKEIVVLATGARVGDDAVAMAV